MFLQSFLRTQLKTAICFFSFLLPPIASQYSYAIPNEISQMPMRKSGLYRMVAWQKVYYCSRNACTFPLEFPPARTKRSGWISMREQTEPRLSPVKMWCNVPHGEYTSMRRGYSMLPTRKKSSLSGSHTALKGVSQRPVMLLCLWDMAQACTCYSYLAQDYNLQSTGCYSMLDCGVPANCPMVLWGNETTLGRLLFGKSLVTRLLKSSL